MGRKDMVERITEAAMLAGEPIMKLPLVEICGFGRVLVEHHMGIGQYSSKSVHVKVRFGTICICGSGLEISKMSAEHLVIIGNISSVTLQKGMV